LCVTVDTADCCLFQIFNFSVRKAPSTVQWLHRWWLLW